MSTLTAKRLLAHLESMTHERERPLLEVALASALRDLLGADRVSVYKLAQAPGESFVWPAVVVGAKGAQVRDDGVSVPEEMVSIERFPRLQACLESGTQQAAGNSSIFPLLKASGACFGFVDIEGRAVDSGQIEVAERLQAIFMNMLALLDYSEVDTLTGLLNRKTFDEYLLRILSSLSGVGDTRFEALHVPHRRQPQPEGLDHWLAVVDIDHFKRVNDSYGHLVGDDVLTDVGALLQSAVRSVDVVARYGGEEFVIALPETGLMGATVFAERIRELIEEHRFSHAGGSELHLTASVGVACYPSPGLETVEDLLATADQALYRAKAEGRNRVRT